MTQKLVFHSKAPRLIEHSPINGLADKYNRPIISHYRSQMARLQSQTPVRDITDLLRGGGTAQAVIDIIPFDKVFGSPGIGNKAAKAAPKKSLKSYLETQMQTILVEAGVATTEEVAEVIPAIGVIGPGALAADSAAWAAKNSSKLITGVSQKSKNAIRATITAGIVANHTPDQIARDIQQIVGLRTPQAASLLRHGEKLASQGVSGSAISSTLTRMRQGLITNRARLIARTETINAANGGQQLTWQIAQREGILTDDNSRKVWIITPDDLLDLVICAPMPDMEENQDLKIGDLFTTGLGAQIEHPTAHPGCRCAQGLVVLD